MNPDYQPEEMETKQVFGIKFEQKRNDSKLTMALFDDMPTKIKDIPEIAKIDLLISLILHLWMMPICLMNILIWDVWHRLISARLLIHRGISEKNFSNFLRQEGFTLLVLIAII